ncbi:MAG: membrane protein insertase YidC, partial [Acetobacteraceae bacterium]
MDQKRLFLAIAISLAIMIGFQMLVAPHLPQPPTPATTQAEGGKAKPGTPSTATPADQAAAAAGTASAAVTVPKNVPRVRIDGKRVSGSISLLGARIDDIVLTDYRETLAPNSPHVRLLEPRSDPQPYYVQYGWTAPAGETIKLPGNDTVWTASGETLTNGKPVTLSWNNGEGLTFEIALSVDDDYMFAVRQTVRNASGQEVKLFPWSRIRRDYKPHVLGYYILFEGLLGVVDGKLHEVTYDHAKSEGEKTKGIAFESAATGGWIGITDKYWLTALIPDQAVPSRVYFRHIEENGDRYQVDTVTQDAKVIPAGGEASLESRMFAGAKLVSLLDHYQDVYKIPSFDKAVDFGWFYFLTKPIFFALDFLYKVLGNFGLAILVF